MTLLAAAYLDDATNLTILRVFDPDAGTTLFTSPSFGAPQSGSPFTVQCAVSIDDAYVSVCAAGTTRIYRTAGWSYVEITGNFTIAFAGDGRVYSETGEIDPDTGVITPFGFTPSWIGSTEISLDGVLMVGRRGFPSYESVVYDLNTRVPTALGTLVNGIVNAAFDAYFRFSPDNRFLAVSHRDGGDNNRISLFDLATTTLITTQPADWVSPIEFSQDGNTLYMPGKKMDTTTFVQTSWVVPMSYGNPFAPTVFVKDQDLACWSNEFNSAFSPNTSGWVVSTQTQSNPAWYSLPTTPKWVATTRGVAPVVPRFWVNTVLTAEAI